MSLVVNLGKSRISDRFALLVRWSLYRYVRLKVRDEDIASMWWEAIESIAEAARLRKDLEDKIDRLEEHNSQCHFFIMNTLRKHPETRTLLHKFPALHASLSQGMSIDEDDEHFD